MHPNEQIPEWPGAKGLAAIQAHQAANRLLASYYRFLAEGDSRAEEIRKQAPWVAKVHRNDLAYPDPNPPAETDHAG
jgi:hypothetical protein